MNIELYQGAIPNAGEAVNLAGLNDQYVAGSGFKLLPIHRPKAAPCLNELDFVIRMAVRTRATAGKPIEEEYGDVDVPVLGTYKVVGAATKRQLALLDSIHASPSETYTPALTMMPGIPSQCGLVPTSRGRTPRRAPSGGASNSAGRTPPNDAARWAVTAERDWTSRNALVLLVLDSRTTLDAVFPWMARIYMPAWSDVRLEATIAVCAADIAAAPPWEQQAPRYAYPLRIANYRTGSRTCPSWINQCTAS